MQKKNLDLPQSSGHHFPTFLGIDHFPAKKIVVQSRAPFSSLYNLFLHGGSNVNGLPLSHLNLPDTKKQEISLALLVISCFLKAPTSSFTKKKISGLSLTTN